MSLTVAIVVTVVGGPVAALAVAIARFNLKRFRIARIAASTALQPTHAFRCHQRLPRLGKVLLAFSDGLAAGDRLNALVYYEARCGGLCGEGGYVWLGRDTVGSPWRIAKKIVSWMS